MSFPYMCGVYQQAAVGGGGGVEGKGWGLCKSEFLHEMGPLRNGCN